MPSLTKVLKGVTDCIIGLQYVWEYRSPSKSVQPHYQCKLCSLARLQHDMVDHVKGWKHGFRYMKKVHPDKVTCEEEDAIKDSAVRRAVKAAAAEVERTEGRGQIKVILKEPFEAPAFKGFRSATPRLGPPINIGMGPPGPPFGPRFPGPGFPGEFPPHSGPPPDFPPGEYGEPDFGGYQARDNFPDRGMDRGPFSDGRGRRPPGGGRDGYGRSGPMNDGPRKMYPDGFRSNQMGEGFVDKPLDRPGLMGKAPDSSRLPNTLLTYLDTFRIENESDAQLVLKVTQKLTDVLMEYRLRSVSTGPSLNSLPMSSPKFSSPPPRLANSGDRYQSLSGPPRYSDGPQRYYK
ncbi:uncharacterized protein FYW49_012024 [Xenentodon cancila]